MWLECRFLDTEVDGPNPGSLVHQIELVIELWSTGYVLHSLFIVVVVRSPHQSPRCGV